MRSVVISIKNIHGTSRTDGLHDIRALTCKHDDPLSIENQYHKYCLQTEHNIGIICFLKYQKIVMHKWQCPKLPFYERKKKYA